MKFKKKPIVVEAEQFVNYDSFPEGVCDCGEGPGDHDPHVHTLEGPLRVSFNDWIIKGIRGEYYPCKPDIFVKTYERVWGE